MKHSVWLLLACSLAGAIPLHKGESWTWLVVDRETNARQWRSAVVLDSVKHDSGVVWRIQARDSLTKGMDTGSILARPDGSQNWLAASQYLPWEPQTLPKSSIGVEFNAGMGRNGAYPWGLAAVSSGLPVWKITSAPGLRTCGFYQSSPETWLIWNCPDHIWNENVGVTRARVSLGHDEALILLVHNGDSATPAPIAIKLPDSGSVMVWKESILDSVRNFAVEWSVKLVHQERRWEIVRRPDDSAGWNRVRIHESLRTDSSNSDSMFDLRLNPMTQERVPSRGNGYATPDEGWWLDWADSLSSQPASRYRQNHTGWITRNRSRNYSGEIESWMRITQGAQIDSMVVSTNDWKAEGGAESWSRSTYTRVLMSVSGKVIRSDAQTGLRSLTRRMASLDLLSLAKLHPALVVRWRDARGQSGQILASDASRSGFGAARGVLYLSAELPEGTPWSCVRVVPR